MIEENAIDLVSNINLAYILKQKKNRNKDTQLVYSLVGMFAKILMVGYIGEKEESELIMQMIQCDIILLIH